MRKKKAHPGELRKKEGAGEKKRIRESIQIKARQKKKNREKKTRSQKKVRATGPVQLIKRGGDIEVKER